METGISLENYDILSTIGEGGMGAVYLAKHKTLDRKVAVKVLHTMYAENESIRIRFINEAKILSKLNHPNIVTLYDFRDNDNLLCLIMEYVDGVALNDVISRSQKPLEEDKVVEIFSYVLDAFGYAHSEGVIHRDIKPSNIILNKNLSPKVLDFGIAKILQSERQLTKTGTKMGSIIYMSPEQILAKEVDLRTDIYSLGVTLYEMLTNQNPYDCPTDSDYQIQSNIINKPLPSVKLTNPAVSDRTDEIIRRATEKDPQRRFNNCREFSEALRSGKSFSSHHQVASASTKIIEPDKQPGTFRTASGNKKPITRNPVFYILIFLIIAIAIVSYVLLNLDSDSKSSKLDSLNRKKDSLDKIAVNMNSGQNSSAGSNTITDNTSSASLPINRIRQFIIHLGKKETNEAYSIYRGYSGSYDKFVSGYGCITKTFIYSINSEYEGESTATIVADYEAYDPCNTSQRWQLRFNMYKENGQWYIRNYTKISSSYIR